MDYSFREEIINITTHAIGLITGIVLFFYTLNTLPTNTNYQTFTASIIYGIGLILMFLTSTTYHSAFKLPKIRPLLRKFDHIAIYIMIAASYTPILWIALKHQNGLLWSLFIWAIALLGTILKIWFTGRLKLLSTISYLLMGWIVVFILPDLIANLTTNELTYLFIGGFFYTIGALFYLRKSMPYAHSIWHLFVIGGAFTHWYSIYCILQRSIH